jgi:hypothetical protein
MAVEEHRSRGFSRDLVLRVAVVLTVAVGAAAWFLLGGNVRPLDPPAGGDEPIGTTVVRSGPVVPGAISDGLVRVGFADFDLDEGMAVDMRFPVPEAGQGGSQTFALGWWLRSDGDVDLQPQPVPTATSYVDDTAWFRFGPVGADGIEAELVVVARDTSASEDDPGDGTKGSTSWRLVLTNPGVEDRAVEVVVYGDIDAGGTPGDDVAQLVTANDWVRTSDQLAEYDVDLRGHGADRYWAGELDPGDLGLVDALYGDVPLPSPNTPLPLSPPPGDLELALGWEQVVVPAGGSTLVSWVVSVNEPAGGPPQPLAAPSTLDLGTIVIGQTSSTSTITLSNTGGIPSELTWVDPPAPFSRVGGTCGPSPLLLASATSCTLDITFSPTAVGDTTADVVVRDGQRTTSFQLTGVGQTVGTTSTTTTSTTTTSTTTTSTDLTTTSRPPLFPGRRPRPAHWCPRRPRRRVRRPSRSSSRWCRRGCWTRVRVRRRSMGSSWVRGGVCRAR